MKVIGQARERKQIDFQVSRNQLQLLFDPRLAMIEAKLQRQGHLDSLRLTNPTHPNKGCVPSSPFEYFEYFGYSKNAIIR